MTGYVDAIVIVTINAMMILVPFQRRLIRLLTV